MVARGSAARKDMIQTLKKATAEMGRMILDLHRLKREKLDFLTTKTEGGPIVKRCLMKDLRDPLTDEGLAESGLYTVDFDNIQAAATAQYLGDCFPETLSEKYLYDCLVVKTPEGGEEMVYGRDQLEKLLKQPAVDCTESFTLAVGIAGKSGAEIRKQIELNVGMMVQIKHCPVWEYVVRAPDLPWPWIELAKREDLSMAIYDKLQLYLLQEKPALSSNKSAVIWKILRADRDAHTAWKALWNWGDLAENPHMSADDYSAFYDELKDHWQAIDVNGSDFLDIVIVTLKKDEQKWDWEVILSHKKLNMKYFQAIKARKTDGPSTEAIHKCSKNKGPGIWQLVAQEDGWNWDWKELSCNPFLDISLFRRYKDKLDFGRLSSNGTTHIWDIVNNVPNEQWDWKELSCNPFLDISLFRRYKDKLDFGRLSSNGTTHIWDIVNNVPNEQWDWMKLSSNKYMTLKDFNEFKNVIDIDKLSRNSGENVPTIFVKHPELPWNLDKLCCNKHLTLVTVLNTRDKTWKLSDLAKNDLIPAPFFKKVCSRNEQDQEKCILDRRAVGKATEDTHIFEEEEDRNVSFRFLRCLVRKYSKTNEKLRDCSTEDAAAKMGSIRAQNTSIKQLNQSLPENKQKEDSEGEGSSSRLPQAMIPEASVEVPTDMADHEPKNADKSPQATAVSSREALLTESRSRRSEGVKTDGVHKQVDNDRVGMDEGNKSSETSTDSQSSEADPSARGHALKKELAKPLPESSGRLTIDPNDLQAAANKLKKPPKQPPPIDPIVDGLRKEFEKRDVGNDDNPDGNQGSEGKETGEWNDSAYMEAQSIAARTSQDSQRGPSPSTESARPKNSDKSTEDSKGPISWAIPVPITLHKAWHSDDSDEEECDESSGTKTPGDNRSETLPAALAKVSRTSVSGPTHNDLNSEDSTKPTAPPAKPPKPSALYVRPYAQPANLTSKPARPPKPAGLMTQKPARKKSEGNPTIRPESPSASHQDDSRNEVNAQNYEAAKKGPPAPPLRPPSHHDTEQPGSGNPLVPPSGSPRDMRKEESQRNENVDKQTRRIIHEENSITNVDERSVFDHLNPSRSISDETELDRVSSRLAIKAAARKAAAGKTHQTTMPTDTGDLENPSTHQGASIGPLLQDNISASSGTDDSTSGANPATSQMKQRVLDLVDNLTDGDSGDLQAPLHAQDSGNLQAPLHAQDSSSLQAPHHAQDDRVDVSRAPSAEGRGESARDVLSKPLSSLTPQAQIGERNRKRSDNERKSRQSVPSTDSVGAVRDSGPSRTRPVGKLSGPSHRGNITSGNAPKKPVPSKVAVLRGPTPRSASSSDRSSRGNAASGNAPSRGARSASSSDRSSRGNSASGNAPSGGPAPRSASSSDRSLRKNATYGNAPSGSSRGPVQRSASSSRRNATSGNGTSRAAAVRNSEPLRGSLQPSAPSSGRSADRKEAFRLM